MSRPITLPRVTRTADSVAARMHRVRLKNATPNQADMYSDSERFAERNAARVERCSLDTPNAEMTTANVSMSDVATPHLVASLRAQ